MKRHEYDYIIVGLGLAGIHFCEQLRQHNKRFVVFNDGSQKSSTVAGGLYNPVVLKRFTPIWKAEQLMQLALATYKNLENLLQVTLDEKLPVYRTFASIEEQNDWFIASDKPVLKTYLHSKVITNTNKAVNAPFGFGEVRYTGRVKVDVLLKSYASYLDYRNAIVPKTFAYEELKIKDNNIKYKAINAKQIVFCEGFGVVKNPFFTTINLSPTKGELLTIFSPKLNINYVLKGPVFVIPIGNHLYRVGATYELNDLTHNTSEKAKNKLLEGLRRMINCPFEIINQEAGIRPTVRDRRPLVGSHGNYKNMYLLNGLGTRGVLIGPYVAKQLFNYIEYQEPLEQEISIGRFG